MFTSAQTKNNLSDSKSTILFNFGQKPKDEVKRKIITSMVTKKYPKLKFKHAQEALDYAMKELSFAVPNIQAKVNLIGGNIRNIKQNIQKISDEMKAIRNDNSMSQPEKDSKLQFKLHEQIANYELSFKGTLENVDECDSFGPGPSNPTNPSFQIKWLEDNARQDMDDLINAEDDIVNNSNGSVGWTYGIRAGISFSMSELTYMWYSTRYGSNVKAEE